IDVLQSFVKIFFYIRVSMSGGRIGEVLLDFPSFSVLSWPMCDLAPQTRDRANRHYARRATKLTAAVSPLRPRTTSWRAGPRRPQAAASYGARVQCRPG